MGSAEKLLGDKFWQDDKWAHDHYQALVKKYPNRWVAIINKKVAASGVDLDRVEKEVAQKAKGRDCPLMFIERGAHVYKD